MVICMDDMVGTSLSESVPESDDRQRVSRERVSRVAIRRDWWPRTTYGSARDSQHAAGKRHVEPGDLTDPDDGLPPRRWFQRRGGRWLCPG
jgi:hypothetical protein